MAETLESFVFHLSNKILDMQKRVAVLERFKSDFIHKQSYKPKNFSFDLDPKLLSVRFGKSYENMRALKVKYLKDKKDNSTWVLYCKAYYFDEIMKGKK